MWQFSQSVLQVVKTFPVNTVTLSTTCSIFVFNSFFNQARHVGQAGPQSAGMDRHTLPHPDTCHLKRKMVCILQLSHGYNVMYGHLIECAHTLMNIKCLAL